MAAITATIITLNEADHIEACVRSAFQVCDQVIVVDSLSDDDTVAIAEKAGAEVYKQAYLGDGPQKAFGTQYAKNDWILSIDADERLDEDMVTAVRKLSLSDPDVAYAFRRKNYVGRHWIKAAGFYPDYVTRLYNRSCAGYESRKAHSKVAASKIVKSQGHLRHFTYRDYSHWVDRINALSSRDAWAMHEAGKPPSSVKPIVSAVAAAFRKYIVKGGLFQGMDGITVTLTTVFRTYMKYTKLNELHEQQQSNRQ